MKKAIKKNNRNSRGFTLVETLVAVAIFSISILAVMATISKGISDTTHAKKRVVATYLAQEGIEYMRNLRDTYTLFDAAGPQAGWDAFHDRLSEAACEDSSGCYFDDSGIDYGSSSQPITALELQSCDSDTCVNAPLYFEQSTGRYNHSSGSATGITRSITINRLNSDETVVTSSVFWRQGSGNYSVILSENLFNWIE